ncbi:MAG: hypothetical protein ACRCU0_01130 [Candidatus Rhabdochlamydia sp.]
MDGLTNTIGQFSHPSQGIIFNEFSYQPTIATKGIRQVSISATNSHMKKLSKAIDQFTPSINNSSQKVPEPVSAMPKQRLSWIRKTYETIVANPFNQLSNSIHNSSQTLVLRGEVPFERWYYHYQLSSATKGLGQLSSRVWASAHTIESAVKIIFIALSIPYYVCMKSKLEKEMKYEALISQVGSFFFSFLAIIIPEVMRDGFKELNTLPTIAKRALILPFKYTRYRGDTTLKMLVNT